MDTERLKEMLEVKLPIAVIARQLQVSRKQIYSHIHKERIIYTRHSTITTRDLKAAITEIKEAHPESGEVMITGHLRQRGLFVQRERIRNALREVDHEGIERRRLNTIHRRVYSVPCPHYIWHLDGNHKLIKWKFVVHGGIDGYTRLITFLHVSNNNRASTVLSQFNHAVQEFQWPLIIRTDHGGENQDVWAKMQEKHGPHAVLVGSSVHNERIGRMWRDVNEKVTRKYKDLFQTMTDDHMVNPDNHTDILCLHWVFRRLIQKDLTEFASAHNCHGISTEGGLSPIQLFTLKKHLTDLHGDFQQEMEDENDDGVHPEHLQFPLPHVQCNVGHEFSPELRAELRMCGRPSTILGGKDKYREVEQIVGRFIARTGHV